ncbi:MAG: MFS transporter [Hyphomicrobiaceae bacterium]
MKAVLSCYTLTVAVFVPVSGWLADRFGTRRVFATAIAFFMLGSLAAGLSNSIHGLVASRILQGFGGAMMVPVGRLTMVRTFPKSELVRAMTFVSMPAMIGPMLGPVLGGFIVHYLNWRVIFLVNLPVALIGLVMIFTHMPDYRSEGMRPLDWVGLVLFSSGLALLSYVLEVFGSHMLPGGAVAVLFAVAIGLLIAYAFHARRVPHPLLRLGLFQIRTFRIAAVGGFTTRFGAAGVPFLLPLLYQIGLGYTAVQSALLILPQTLTALTVKAVIPRILGRFGYRAVLNSNTIAMGALIALFSTVGPSTPVGIIVLQAFAFGFCQSLQYTSMNTLVYADIGQNDASMAATMASTLQQMSMSFGVAAASLTAAVFIPDALASNPQELISGIHSALIALGAMTILSTVIFRGLKRDDGAEVSMRGDVAKVTRPSTPQSPE